MKVKLYYLNELNPLAQVRALANTLICEKSVYCVELNAMRERLKGGYFDIHAAINGLNMEFIRLRNSRQISEFTYARHSIACKVFIPTTE